MSDLWRGESVASAIRVSPFAVRPREEVFQAWGTRSPILPQGGEEPFEAEPAAIDIDALQSEAFAEGVEAGRRAAEASLASERAALQALARSLETLQPEAPASLGLLLAETVGRLVRQVVGEVELDRERIVERATAAAALVINHSRPAKLRINPADVDRVEAAGLAVELVADGSVAEGSLRLDCTGGSVEDGPEVALAGLRQALDKLGIAR